jgi:hypothetical protein
MDNEGGKHGDGIGGVPADGDTFESFDGFELPEPTFVNLIMSLSSNALIHLGIVRDPNDEGEVNPEMAKHLIDTIAMLEEKTRGNLDETETKYISEIIYQLKIAYVNVINQR